MPQFSAFFLIFAPVMQFLPLMNIHRILLPTLLLVLSLPAQAKVSRLRQQKLSRWGIAPANYSGIAPMGGNRYAVVSDDEPQDGYFEWEIEQDSLTGKVRQVRLVQFHASGLAPRDAEGVAFCPQRASLFVSAEDDQQILEFTPEGRATGHALQVPRDFRADSIRPDRGFEALTCHPASGRLFTVTENTRPADGPTTERPPYPSATLQLLSFSPEGPLLGRQSYPLDAPRRLRKRARLVHGVTALCATADTALLVLERESGITPRKLGSYVTCKLYHFDLMKERKTLLNHWTTWLRLCRPRWANYEALCQGRTLADGRRTLLLLSDSQGGLGNHLFHLKDYILVIVLDN